MTCDGNKCYRGNGSMGRRSISSSCRAKRIWSCRLGSCALHGHPPTVVHNTTPKNGSKRKQPRQEAPRTTTPTTTTTTVTRRMRVRLTSLRLSTVVWLAMIVLPSTTTNVVSATNAVVRFAHVVQFFLDIILGHHSMNRRQTVGSVSSTGGRQSQQNRHRHHHQHHGLKVIGAGWPRTGTKSIELALIEQDHRIYDFRSVTEHGHLKEWVYAAEDWKLRNDTSTLARLLDDIEDKGYTATLDFPPHMLAVPMAELRPQAKILLSVRENPEVWYRSYLYIMELGTVYWTCRPWSWISPNLVEMYFPLNQVMFGITQPPVTYPEYKNRLLPWYEQLSRLNETHFRKDEFIAAYEQHNADVIENVSPDRLLVFNVKDGWAPWVKFFDLPNRTDAFPYVNDKSTVDLGSSISDALARGFPVVVLFVAFSLAYTLRLINQILRSVAVAAMVLAAPRRSSVNVKIV